MGNELYLFYVDKLAPNVELALTRETIEAHRTHFNMANNIILQILVHLQDRHTPIYCDDVYGSSNWNKWLAKMH